MLIDFLGILLAFVFSAFISGLAYNVTFNRVLPFLQRYDKVQLLASTVLGGTILVSCFALVKAVSIAQVANGLPDQEASELWQAAAALVQVPLIGVASVALYRWSVQRKIGPEIKVGVFPPAYRRAEVDVKKRMASVGRHIRADGQKSSADKRGAQILIANSGERALERPKVQITPVVPDFSDKSLNDKFKEVELHALEIFGFKYLTGTHGYVTTDKNDYMFIGDIEQVLSPGEVWSISFRVAQHYNDNGYGGTRDIPFELALLRVRVWGANLENALDEYLVLTQDVDSVPDNLMHMIKNRNFKIKETVNETIEGTENDTAGNIAH